MNLKSERGGEREETRVSKREREREKERIFTKSSTAETLQPLKVRVVEYTEGQNSSSQTYLRTQGGQVSTHLRTNRYYPKLLYIRHDAHV